MTQKLEPAKLNYNELLKEVKGNNLRQRTELIRSKIEVFYNRGSVTESIAKLNKKHHDEEKALEKLKEITIENKTDEDLIKLLTDREELMRGRALELLYEKLSKSRSASLISLLRANAKSLVRSLNTKILDVLRMSLLIIQYIIDDKFKNEFREAGGIRPLANLLCLPEEDPEFIIILLDVISRFVTIEENREAIRLVHGLVRLVPFLSHKNDQIKLLATEALKECTYSANNQPVIAKPNILLIIYENSEPERNFELRYSSFALKRNLCQSEQARDILRTEDFRQAMVILDAEKVYNQVHTQAYKECLDMHLISLELLFEMAGSANNQKMLDSWV